MGQFWTVVNNLIGFGATAAQQNSHVTVRDVRLQGQPQTRDDSVTTAEDAVAQIVATANDIDADQEDYASVVVAGPAHGQVLVNADGSFSYTPAQDYFGEDSFTYKLDNGVLESNVSTVSITITPVNDAPVAQSLAVTTAEDTAVTINLAALASDVDADALSFSIGTQPQHGVLELNADGTVIYTPAENYFGADRFTYRVNDGTVSTEGVITLNVTPVNDAPVAQATAMTLLEDGSAVFDWRALSSDVDGDALVVTTTQPANGAVTQNADGTFTYQPAADFNGADAFTYTITDGALSSTATVSLTVVAVNDAPVAQNLDVTTAEDTAVTINLAALAFDIDADVLSFSIATQPQHGVLELAANGTVIYTPAANYFGADSFTYFVNDGTVSTEGVITLAVTSVNDAPTAQDDAVTLAEDSALHINVLGNDQDIDGDALSSVLVQGPQHGELVRHSDGSFTYTAAANFNGTDRFTYQVNDGAADSGVAEVLITVTAVNDAPVATPVVASLQEDGSVVLNLRASAHDVDGDSLSVRVTDPQSGQLVQNLDGSYTYRPHANVNGEDGFSYTVSDGVLESTATVRLTITAVNDAPVAVNDMATLVEDGSILLTLLANDADVDGDALTLLIDRQPAHGTLTIHADNTVTYTAALNYSGEDSFSYRVSDGELLSGLATVRLVLAAVADAPTLVLGDRHGASREVFRTSWEGVDNKNSTSTLVRQRELEGWTVVTPANHSWGGQHGFEIWSEGDRMRPPGTGEVHGGAGSAASHNQQGRPQVVHAAAGKGHNWLELNDAQGLGHQTLGIERSVDTVAGATYTLSFDYAGRLGYPAETSRIGIYVDDVRIATHAASSPATALDWKALRFSFTGTGGVQSLRLVTEGTAPQANGRGAMIDDIALQETLPANTGWEDSAIPLSALTALLTDTDGSESLRLTLEALPVGATLTDGIRSFTASAGHTTADITGWALGSLSLVPPLDFHGTMTLKVVATATEQANADQARTEAALAITVLPVNDAPVALNAVYQVQQDGSVRIDFAELMADVDGDALSLSLSLTPPAHGTLTRQADGSYLYRPARRYSGTDSFSYSVNDGKVSSTGKITLHVLSNEADGSASITVQSVLGLGTSPSNPPNTGHLVYGSAADLNVVAAATVQPSGLTVNWTAGVATVLGNQSCGPSSVDEKWLKELLGTAEKLDLATQTGLVVKVQR